MGYRIEWDDAALVDVIANSPELERKLAAIAEVQSMKCLNQIRKATKANGKPVAHGTLRYDAMGFKVDKMQQIGGWPVAIIHPASKASFAITAKHPDIIHW